MKNNELAKMMNKHSINNVYDKVLFLMTKSENEKLYPSLALEIRSVRDRHFELIDRVPEIVKIKIK